MKPQTQSLNNYFWNVGNDIADIRLLAEGAVALYENDAVPLHQLGMTYDEQEAASAFDTIGTALYDLRNPEKGHSSRDCYECSTHKLTGRYKEDKCCTHNISSKAVRELVLESIRQVSKYALENEEAFIQQVRKEAEIQYEAAAKDLRKKLRKDQRRRDELDVLLKRLYESYALGKLPEKRYEALSAEYEQEQAALEISLAEDQHSLEIFLEDTTRIDQFMELAKKYTDLSELTTPMLNEFVDKILVHAPVKDPKYGRMQQVDVYLNFVGCVQIPSPEPTAEELEELKRLARRREINKQTYARRKERERQKKLLALEQVGQEEASL